MANVATVPGRAASGIDYSGAFKNALGGALIAFVLAVPILSHQTQEDLTNLKINLRWELTAIAVALTFIVRYLAHIFFWSRVESRPRAAGAGPSLLTQVTTFAGRYLALALLIFMLFLPFLPFANRYYIDVGISILTYVMLGWGLNIVVGLAGLLDLGYVAFFAIGAYTYALLSTHFGMSFWLCLPLAGILAAFWGILLGFPVLRLRGDYLAIVTLAFGEIIRVVLINWTAFTNGPKGILDIPRPSFFGIEFNNEPGGFADVFGLEFQSIHRIIFLYYLILALALLTNWFTMQLRRQPIGRAWEALREDEIACRSLGINTTTTKLSAFAIGALFAGFAGAFFATRLGAIAPESFKFDESARILAIVVLGGLGSQIGVALAAAVMVGGIEVLRNLNFLKSEYLFGPEFDPVQYRMLLFGIALVAIMIWKPRGFVTTREPTATLGKGKAASISSDNVKEGHG